MRSTNRLTAALALSVTALAPTPARADAWGLVGSTWTYDLGLTVNVSAFCGSRRPILNGTCAVSGNRITLTHDATTLFLTFVANSQHIEMPLGHSRTDITYGRIEEEVIGDPDAFRFPYINSGVDPTFGFGITFAHTNAAGVATSAFVPRVAYLHRTGDETSVGLGGLGHDTVAPWSLGSTGAIPGTSRNLNISIGDYNHPVVSAIDGAVLPVTATVTLNPEPDDVALLATGLALIGGVAAWRRRPTAAT